MWLVTATSLRLHDIDPAALYFELQLNASSGPEEFGKYIYRPTCLHTCVGYWSSLKHLSPQWCFSLIPLTHHIYTLTTVIIYFSYYATPANRKHLNDMCTMPAQRLRWSNIVQMLYKCFVFAGTARYVYHVGQWWARVIDAVPALNQHWFNMLCC